MTTRILLIAQAAVVAGILLVGGLGATDWEFWALGCSVAVLGEYAADSAYRRGKQEAAE